MQSIFCMKYIQNSGLWFWPNERNILKESNTYVACSGHVNSIVQCFNEPTTAWECIVLLHEKKTFFWLFLLLLFFFFFFPFVNANQLFDIKNLFQHWNVHESMLQRLIDYRFTFCCMYFFGHERQLIHFWHFWLEIDKMKRWRFSKWKSPKA